MTSGELEMEATSPNTGIVYYSRSGRSERLATTLSNRLNGTLIEMLAPRYAPGIIGYMRAGYDSLRQKCVLEPQSFASLAKFDRVVICGPVWTSYPATPIRALLKSDVGLPQNVSLFLTSGSHSPAEKAWVVAAQDLGRFFLATAVLGNSLEGTDEGQRFIDQFVDDLGPIQHPTPTG
jgi:hypothetical protein